MKLLERFVFDFDKSTYHRTICHVCDFGFQPAFNCNRPHLCDNLFNPLRGFHVSSRGFECCSLVDVTSALGHQSDDLPIKSIYI